MSLVLCPKCVLPFENINYKHGVYCSARCRGKVIVIKQDYCECGGVILADSEDWDDPKCHSCLERIATQVCKKLKRDHEGVKYKMKDCKCRPCESRIIVWGENINVIEQENRRAAVIQR